MRALLLSHSDGGGGAARAAYRLQQALVASGVDSTMHVDFKDTDDPRVRRNAGALADVARRLRISIEEIPAVIARHPSPRLFSPGLMSAISARRINATGVDIVNAHWTNFGYLSIGQIGRITKPFVWTLHDMWAFTGGLNYAPDDAAAPWRSGYTGNAGAHTTGRWDVERWVWRRKHKHWKHPLRIITPSDWLASLAQQSGLLADSRVWVIPNALDTAGFRPYPRSVAREFHGLPPDATIVLFGLANDLEDPRKGWDLLKAALLHARSLHPDVELAVMGPQRPPVEWSQELPKAHWLGRLSDDMSLAMAYSAADMTIVPSRQDNLPQVGTEAQACGCPVIAFQVSGLSDVVAHEMTGYLAPDLSPRSLSNAITNALNDRDRLRNMGLAARERAVSLWSPDVVARKYHVVYQEVIDLTRR